MAGMITTALVLFSPWAVAQNINDLIRIFVPPISSQPRPPVYDPGGYIPPRASPQPIPQPLYVPVAPRVSIEQVIQTQQMLNDLGYDTGGVDGVAGSKTINALNAFRRHYGMAMSATIDKQTITVLSSAHTNAVTSGTQVASTVANKNPGTRYGAPYGALAAVSAPQQADVSSPRATPGTVQPSFDCALARSPSETAVCSDAALSTLDRQLAALYTQALSSRGPQESRGLSAEQRQWLSQRDTCSDDSSCLLTAYAQRIASITAAPPTPLAPSASLVQAIAPNKPYDDHHKSSGSDLSRLANPPSGLRPIKFSLFNGLPVLTSELSGHLFTLMSVAEKLPPREQECMIYRSVLFTEEAIKQFLKDDRLRCWHGKDEFQIADTRREFYARYLDVIKSFTPKPPFRVVVIGRNRLGAYDADAQHFQLEEPLSLGLGSSLSFGYTGKLRSSIGNAWPEPILPADEAAARALLEKTRLWADEGRKAKKTQLTGRDVSVVGVIDVLAIDYTAGQVDLGVVSLSVYDPGLTEKIYDFPISASFDSLIRGNFPDRFNVPAPAALDSVYALVQTIGQDKSADDATWRGLYRHLRERDKAFYALKSQERLADDDPRLPVFPNNVADYTVNDREKLEKWATAYRAGLPEELVLAEPQLPPELNRDQSAYIFAPLRHEESQLKDYTAILEAEGIQKEQASLWYRDSGSIRALLIVPNLLDFYSLSVDRSELRPGYRQRMLFRTGPVKPAVDATGKKVLIMYLEPISLTVENDTGMIAQRTFEDIPHLDGSFVAAKKEPEPRPSEERIIDLSPPILDLITLNAMRDKIPDAAVAHMVVRRWLFENSKGNTIDRRFFVKGMRQPNVHEVTQIIPQFRAWSAEVGPTTPLTLRIGAGVVHPEGNNLFKEGKPTQTWSILQCSSSIAQPYKFTGQIKRSPAEMAAYYALAKHDTHNGNQLYRESFKREQQRTFNKQMQKAEGRSSETPEEDAMLVNLKAAYEISRRFYRLGETCGLLAQDLENLNPANVFLYSQDALPAIVQEPGDLPVTSFQVMLEVTGGRLEPREPHYSDLLPAKLVEEYQLAPPKRLPMETIVLESRLKEVIYFNDSGTEVARLPPYDGYSTQELLDSVAALESQQSNKQMAELDVVGITLGMTMEDAEKIIRKQMDVGRVLTGKRLYDGSLNSSRVIPGTSGKLFISKNEQEIIGILDEPPAVSGKVLAAWRRVYVPAGTLLPDEALAGLQEKYGEPTSSYKQMYGGGTYMWRAMGQNPCVNRHNKGVVPALSAIWTDKGERIDLKQGDGRPIPDAALPQPLREPDNPEFQQKVDCGPVVTTLLNFDASNNLKSRSKTAAMDWIEQNLTDLEPYMQAFQTNRETAKASQENDAGLQSKQKLPGGLTF